MTVRKATRWVVLLAVIGLLLLAAWRIYRSGREVVEQYFERSSVATTGIR